MKVYEDIRAVFALLSPSPLIFWGYIQRPCFALICTSGERELRELHAAHKTFALSDGFGKTCRYTFFMMLYEKKEKRGGLTGHFMFLHFSPTPSRRSILTALLPPLVFLFRLGIRAVLRTRGFFA